MHARCNCIHDHNIKVTNDIRFKLVRSLIAFYFKVKCFMPINLTYLVKCLPLTNRFNVEPD
jgi:hypothetical protein